MPVPERGDTPFEVEPLATGTRVQAPLVEHFGRVGADVGMEPPGPVEEEAEVVRHDPLPVEHVRERRALSAWRVDALKGLVKLLRVAEENEVRRGERGRQGVCEGHLARFVDEEDIDALSHVLAGPEPGRSSNDIQGTLG